MSSMPGDVIGAPPAAKGPAGSRRLLWLALTILFGIGFGLVAASTFAAWAGGFLGAVGGLVLGLVFTWILPLVLTIRADRALKRQRRPLVLRRVVTTFLVVLVQFTFFLLGFSGLGDGPASSTASIAQASLPLLGHVPVLGGLLGKHAKDGGATGLTTTTDPVATGTTTAGTTTTATTTTAVATGLSPRTAGRAIGSVAAVATTDDGGLVAVRTTVAFGGQPTITITDLSAFADKGVPTRVESSADGHLAVVLGGQVVLTAPPGKAAVVDAAISRGAKVGDLDVQSIRDVAVGPGGAVLVAVDAFDAKKNSVGQALIARPIGGAAFIVRRSGTPIEGEKLVEGEAPDVAHGYSIKRHDGQGHVVVEEIMLEDDTDIGTKLDGAQYAMNPRRLLVGTIDNPRALAELVRTGDQPSGIENVALQGFADAVALPDGRVIFDANFAEDGPRGWLFSARLGGSAFAIAPELVGKPEAPFADRAPRAAKLSVEPEGGFVFVNRDGALVLGHLQRLADHKTGLLRADVVSSAGRAGGVARVNAARLLSGGEWLLANVDVLDDAGQRREALVLASRADIVAGKAELLALEGGAIPAATVAPAAAPPPTTTTTTPDGKPADAKPADKPADAKPADVAVKTGRMKSLFVLEGHDEALWGLGL